VCGVNSSGSRQEPMTGSFLYGEVLRSVIFSVLLLLGRYLPEQHCVPRHRSRRLSCLQHDLDVKSLRSGVASKFLAPMSGR
jgi:hypothetical protein